jgi:hypothetical protein
MSCALCLALAAGPFPHNLYLLFYQQPGSIATSPAEPIRYRPSAIGNPCALCPLQCCQSAVVVRFLSNFRDKLGIFDFAFFVNNYYASGVKSCKGTVS